MAKHYPQLDETFWPKTPFKLKDIPTVNMDDQPLTTCGGGCQGQGCFTLGEKAESGGKAVGSTLRRVRRPGNHQRTMQRDCWKNITVETCKTCGGAGVVRVKA